MVLLDALGSVGDTFGRPEDCFAQLGARRTQYSDLPPSPGYMRRYVPMLIALLGFRPHVATALSQSMLFGGGIAALRSRNAV